MPKAEVISMKITSTCKCGARIEVELNDESQASLTPDVGGQGRPRPSTDLQDYPAPVMNPLFTWHTPPEKCTDLISIMGHWPGDETDEQIREALK